MNDFYLKRTKNIFHSLVYKNQVHCPKIFLLNSYFKKNLFKIVINKIKDFQNFSTQNVILSLTVGYFGFSF